MSPDSPVKRGQNRLAQQPFDLREGVSNAYQVFREVRQAYSAFFTYIFHSFASLFVLFTCLFLLCPFLSSFFSLIFS